MNKFQLLMNDLHKWNTQAEDYVHYAKEIGRELQEIERVLNDFRHLRENYRLEEDVHGTLVQLDKRERELLQRRRAIKAELQHYEKCRPLFESIRKQTEQLMQPQYHNYQTVYCVKSKEGDQWFQRFHNQGLESIVQISAFQQVQATDDEELLDEQPLASDEQPIQVHINKTKKYWIAHDVNRPQTVFQSKKLTTLLDKLPPNVQILKAPKTNLKFIRDYKRQQ